MSEGVSPLRWALLGLEHAGARRYDSASPDELREWLGGDVSDSAVKAVTKFDNADDPQALARAIQSLGLDRDKVGDAMEVADAKVKVLTHKDKRPGSFTHKYIPEVIESAEDGTVYMCKSVNGNKAMMAWDLNPSNVVVKVDEYDPYKILGWELLKDFPHGERQIREQYGDQLSDDVLLALCGPQGGSGNSQTSSQTAASKETLTISVGRRDHHKFKEQADTLKEEFRQQGQATDKSLKRLVLFPTGTDENLSDNWWIVGSFGESATVGFANCNKSTYEYLSDLDEVWHIDDYLSQAEDYEVVTSEGKMPLGEVDDPVVFTTSEKPFNRLTSPRVIDNLLTVLKEQCEGKWKSPDLDGDETLIILDDRHAFRARPLLHNAETVLYGDTEVRDIGEDPFNAGHEYLLYAKARLSDWDWDSPELHALENQCWNLKMDDGGFELIETLAMLHDNDRPLYSETPLDRWEQ